MSRVRAFFVEEAAECMTILRGELRAPSPDPVALHAAVRRLRGSAQVARFGDLAREASVLESLLKPVAKGGAVWEETLGRRLKEGLESLARGIDAVREGRTEQDAREGSVDEARASEAPSDGDVVSMESLEYGGSEALNRAQALRGPLEDAIIEGEPAGAILDELFDLIRLGTK